MGPQREEVRSGLEVTAQGWIVKEENGSLVLAFKSQGWAHHSLKVRDSFLGSHREKFLHYDLQPRVLWKSHVWSGRMSVGKKSQETNM